MLPLEGILVLEIGHQVAAPYCSMLLSDMGAEVWKIEKPGEGDGTRRWNLSKPGGAFYALNRNKKSITLDIRNGKEVLLPMIKKADVLVENFAPGAMKKYGLSYEQVASINPRMIYCSISGYGSGGPYSDLPGWDPVIQALSGYMSLIGYEGEPYARAPSSTFDQSTGMLAAMSILSALRLRDKTGKGTKVEVSLLDTIISVLGYMITDYSRTGVVPKRQGSGMDFRAPYGIFPTKTQHIYIAVAGEEDWNRFCNALHLSDLLGDERFTSLPKRVKNKKELNALVENAFSKLEAQEITNELIKFGIPCAPVNDLSRTVADPHVVSRKMLVDMEVAPGENAKIANSPFRFETEDKKNFSRPPALGEHTDLILKECGFDESKIASLRNQKLL